MFTITTITTVFVIVAFLCCVFLYILYKYESLQMEFRKKMEKGEVIIYISGGLVQNVEIPEHLKNAVVVVKDYDTDSDSMVETEKDEDGVFVRSEWTYE